MRASVNDYATLVFDCDGVVLNSNKIKTDAFFKTALPYGEVAAKALVAYHVDHGGVSRYKKFAHFLDEIVPAIAPGSDGPDLAAMLRRYADEVHHGLMTCEIATGLRALRERTPCARWMIVSGGDQNELRGVFAARGLDLMFDGGIFGSPDTKVEILDRELAAGQLPLPALFFGDSRLDHVAASAYGLDFLFVSQWTEFESWRMYCLEHSLASVDALSAVI